MGLFLHEYAGGDVEWEELGGGAPPHARAVDAGSPSPHTDPVHGRHQSGVSAAGATTGLRGPGVWDWQWLHVARHRQNHCPLRTSLHLRVPPAERRHCTVSCVITISNSVLQSAKEKFFTIYMMKTNSQFKKSLPTNSWFGRLQNCVNCRKF